MARGGGYDDPTQGGASVQVRIGVSYTDRVVEFDVEDAELLVGEIEDAFASGKLLKWFVDSKGRRVGVPLDKIAYVEIEGEEGRISVGFSASSE